MELALVLALVAAFHAEWQGAKQATRLDFLEWIERHDFETLKGRLEGNEILLTGIDQMLKEDRETLSARFDSVDRMLAGIAGGIEDLRDVSRALRPEAQISNQAHSILRQFLESGAATMAYHRTYGFLFIGGTPTSAEIGDNKFIQDDLAVLVEVGFIRHTGYNDQGAPLYSATRLGQEYLNLIDNAE